MLSNTCFIVSDGLLKVKKVAQNRTYRQLMGPILSSTLYRYMCVWLCLCVHMWATMDCSCRRSFYAWCSAFGIYACALVCVCFLTLSTSICTWSVFVDAGFSDSINEKRRLISSGLLCPNAESLSVETHAQNHVPFMCRNSVYEHPPKVPLRGAQLDGVQENCDVDLLRNNAVLTQQGPLIKTWSSRNKRHCHTVWYIHLESFISMCLTLSLSLSLSLSFWETHSLYSCRRTRTHTHTHTLHTHTHSLYPPSLSSKKTACLTVFWGFQLDLGWQTLVFENPQNAIFSAYSCAEVPRKKDILISVDIFTLCCLGLP